MSDFTFLSQSQRDDGIEYESPQFEFGASENFVYCYLDPHAQDWDDEGLQVTLYLDRSTDGGFNWEVWDNDTFTSPEMNPSSPSGYPFIGRGGGSEGEKVKIRMTLNRDARIGVEGHMQDGESAP